VKNRRQGRAGEGLLNVTGQTTGYFDRPFCFSMGVAAGAFLRRVHYAPEHSSTISRPRKQRRPEGRRRVSMAASSFVSLRGPVLGRRLIFNGAREGCARRSSSPTINFLIANGAVSSGAGRAADARDRYTTSRRSYEKSPNA